MADINLSAFAGIHNTLPPERINSTPTRDNPAIDLVEAVNVDVDNSGQLSRRTGLTLLRSGATHSLWAGNNECLFVSGNTLYRMQPDFTAVDLVGGLAPGLPLAYAEVNGRIYWSNGTQTGIIDSHARAWGMPMPATPAVAAIAGTLPAGAYQALLTTVRADGQESGAGLPARIDLADGQGVRFAWDAPADPTIAAVNLYLSEPNGMVLYKAASAAPGAASADVTGSALALPLNTQWLDQPPAGHLLAYHRGRIFIAQGEFVFATAAYGYEYCDLRDYLALDGARVQVLIGVEGGLFIGTAERTYFVSGTKLEDMERRVVVDAPAIARSGVLADGMAVTGNPELAGRQVALFATTAGVCLGMPDGSITNLTASRYTMPAGIDGAAVFRNTDLLNQYLLFAQG